MKISKYNIIKENEQYIFTYKDEEIFAKYIPDSEVIIINNKEYPCEKMENMNQFQNFVINTNLI